MGIRTSSPTAALDVDGTIKGSGSLNINTKGLFVEQGNQGVYLQSKDYGSGNFNDLSGASNQPKTTPAFGSGGKIIENTFIKTIKIQGSAFINLDTPAVIVPKQGTDKYIVPVQAVFHSKYGTRSGIWGGQDGTGVVKIGTFQFPANTGNFANWITLDNQTANSNGDWLARRIANSPQSKQFANRDLVMVGHGSTFPAYESTAPDGAWYVTIEYMILDEVNSFSSNVDLTIGTAF